MIDFTCPQCGMMLRVPDDSAGKKGKCKGCGTSVVVPSDLPSPLFDVAATSPFPFIAINDTGSKKTSRTERFDNQQTVGAWLGVAGILAVGISTLVKWTNFGAGGLIGLQVEAGKIVLASAAIALLIFLIGLVSTNLRAPGLLVVQTWAILVAFWMGQFIWRIGSISDLRTPEIGPLGSLFATLAVSPGLGLYIGLIGGVVIAVSVGLILIRQMRSDAGVAMFWMIPILSGTLGVVMILFGGPDFHSKGTSTASEQPQSHKDLRLGSDNQKLSKTEVPDPWRTASTTEEDETVRVEIVRAEIGKVATRDLGGDDELSDDEWLKIVIKIQNRSEGKKFTYSTWGEFIGMVGISQSTELTDDLGNAYRLKHIRDVVGRADYQSVYPKTTITDILVFEVPVSKAKFLKLTLPKSQCGDGDGAFHLKIPARLFARAALGE